MRSALAIRAIPSNRLLVLQYALTIFLAAFLLFQVQPIVGKMILPWFGGSASVWTTCMLFFQVLLLLGYLYSHWIVSRLSPNAQSAVHLSLLVSSLFLLHPTIEMFAHPPRSAADIQVQTTCAGFRGPTGTKHFGPAPN